MKKITDQKTQGQRYGETCKGNQENAKRKQGNDIAITDPKVRIHITAQRKKEKPTKD